MENIIKFKNPNMSREKMREQACVWLAKLDVSVKNIDFEELNGWLNENPEHLEVLLEMADLWDQMSVLSELSEVFPLARYTRLPGRDLWFKGATVFATCVCLALVFVVGLNWVRGLTEAGNASQIARQNTSSFYETQIGQHSTVALSDGSKVVLNTNSLIEIVYSDIERSVFLRRGEALFTVAKDESRLFRVFAGPRVIEAVGTAFSVQRTQEDSVEVMVTEGKVNFRILRQDVELSTRDTLIEDFLQNSDVLPLEAGEFVAAPNAAPESVTKRIIQVEEMEVKLAWQHGMLLFRGDPLEQVLREFGRYTIVKLEATDAVRNIKVEGYFPAGDVERLLVGLEKNLQIDVQEINEKHFVLTAR